MWQNWKVWRKQRVFLGIVSAVLLLAGGEFVFTKLDFERLHSEPERVRKLATASLPREYQELARLTDWPQWRGANRDGSSLETGLLMDWPAGGPPVIWKQAVGRGLSSVAIANGRLFTMEEDAIQAEHDAAATPCYQAVTCRDAQTGKEIWRFRYHEEFTERFGSGPRSTPAVDGNFVYAVGPTGIFHCLRADTGEKVWRHDLMEEFQGRKMQYGVSFSPLVEGDLVYATPGGPDGNSVVAFNKYNGQVVWKALDDTMGYSSPVVVTAAGVRQLLVLTNIALVSLTPKEGKLNWRYPWETDHGFNIATPLAFGDYVFISSAYRKGCALLEITAGADGSLQANRVYELNRMRNYFSGSVRWGDYIYGFDEMDLVCMNLRTGESVWREKGIRTFRKGSLLVADGQLIIMGEGGTLFVVEATPTGYHKKSSFRVSENKSWTVPALANGKLYVRDESQLLCLDLKK